MWNEDLRTGIADIDEQHKSLFETIDKLSNCCSNKAQFYEALIELQTYVSVHFKTEEKYMRYLDYPDYQEHKSCHDKFTEDYRAIFQDNTSVDNLLELAPLLVKNFENWLINHYTKEDVKMAKFIKACHYEDILDA